MKQDLEMNRQSEKHVINPTWNRRVMIFIP